MFSKTRIFYYDNAANTTIIGNYDDFNIEVPQVDSSYPFLTVGVPSSKHGWSYIPVNSYGLFCTFAEIQSLVENNDSFVPKNIEITLGHTIPLARYPSTANSTQLSFNNTIYSLIACNEDGYIGLNSYVQPNEILNFARTFDGVSATDGQTRMVLPKRDIFFRIPYHTLPTTAVTAPADQVMYGVTNANTTSTPITDANKDWYAQTIRQTIDSYIPELLQNNDNVYTLYPGENQYQKNISNLDPEYCALDCSGPAFNETIWQLDQRLNTLINRDTPGTNRTKSNVMSLPIIYNIKGNNNDTNPSDFQLSTPDNNWAKLTDIYNNRSAMNDYTGILPKIFIKGVPIVDGDNNLIPHTFCCTITWTLHVETKPRSNMTTNRMQWAMTYPYLRAKFSSANNVVTTDYIQQSNFAKKPYRFNTFKRTPMLRYKNLNFTQLTSQFNRTSLKNVHKNNVDALQVSVASAPDNILPSLFGYTLPFAAGWFEGHAFQNSVPVNSISVVANEEEMETETTTKKSNRR